MNDLGSSWYINSDAEDVEVYKITEDMIIYLFAIYEEKI